MNSPQLIFDSDAAARSFADILNSKISSFMHRMMNEVSGKLKTSDGKKDLSLSNGKDNDVIFYEIVGSVCAVLDSYGTGSEMDKSNPALSEYMSSELWNRARSGFEIVGREKGSYTNIFGKKQYSSGRKAGQSLENKYPPQKPSYAFQHAETWYLNEQKIQEEIVDPAINEWLSGISNFFSF